MKRLYILAAAVPMFALVAAAQPEDAQKMKLQLEKMVAESKTIAINGGVMGNTVKGAPYSAVEVNENTQVLADGTRIHNETQTTVYRDSEGRVRRETPKSVTIWDPVANVSYFINPQEQTAQKSTLAFTYAFRTNMTPGVAAGEAGADFHYEMLRTSKNGETSVTVNGQPVDPSTVKMEHGPTMIAIDGAAGEKMMVAEMKAKVAAEAGAIGAAIGPPGPGRVMVRSMARDGKTEALGKQSVEGVLADGTRITSTMDVGTIGNDRPIQSISERWYSPDLQTVVMTKHTDPRTGEETFKLTNINRNEPAAYLFQVPAGYQLIERK